MKLKKERNKFERKLDEYNHTMEFIRTIVPIAVPKLNFNEVGVVWQHTE